MKEDKKTTILFQNKHRVINTLRAIEQIFGPRQMVYIGIELTKFYERSIRCEVQEMYQELNENADFREETVKGEVTMIIAPYSAAYNKDLKAEEKPTEQSLQDKEKEAQMHRIEAKHLVTILRDNLEVSDKELGELTAQILNISKTQVREIIREAYPRKHILNTDS